MTYERFEDLPVWKEAIRLAEGVYSMTAKGEFRTHGSLRDQVERAAVSVSNNIAEGFERGTTAELLSFIYIARGSAGEGRSMLNLFERIPPFSNFKSEISNLKTMAESCSRQLRGWAGSLQDSPIKGQRRLNSRVRAEYEQSARAQEFMKKLNAMLPPGHPLRKKSGDKEV